MVTARTATRLYTGGLGVRVGLYVVPTITTSDTVDLGSTGLNDFSKVFLAYAFAFKDGAYAATSLTAATNLTVSTTSLTGEDVFLFVIGAST